MKYPKQEELNSSNCKERSIEIHYPEFYKYIIENYNCKTWNENLYWFYKDLKEYPGCPVCGKPTKFINVKKGYQVYCSKKCSNSDASKKELTKQTCKDKYGGVAPACSKEVRYRMKQTNLERFGVENAMQNEEVSNRSQQTREEMYGGCGNASKESHEKYKSTILERYGVDNPMKSKKVQDIFRSNLLDKYGVESTWKIDSVKSKIIQTCLERYGNGAYNNPEKQVKSTIREYGVEHPFQIPGVLDKINQTKRKNNTFNTSQIEELFKEYLDNNNIEYIRQYKCERYPFNCDFYIKEYDLFIEIQANWCHGFRSFDENDKSCLDQLSVWINKNTKYYKNAIETWTVRDVNKRNKAKENNLNYLEIFSNNINEVIYEYTKAIDRLKLRSK